MDKFVNYVMDHKIIGAYAALAVIFTPIIITIMGSIFTAMVIATSPSV